MSFGTLFTVAPYSWSKTAKTVTHKNSGTAMEPTLGQGQNMVVREFGPESKKVKRGDIVVFPYPENPLTLFMMRVIALEGERLEIKNKKVLINDKFIEEPYVQHKDINMMPVTASNRDNMKPVVIPQGSLFLMGDNRDRTLDSRFWGYVKSDDLIGVIETK